MKFSVLRNHGSASSAGWTGCTFDRHEAGIPAHVPFVSAVRESGAVDVFHQLRKRLREEGEVDFVPDVVFSALQQVQKSLQEGTQLYMQNDEGGGITNEEKKQTTFLHRQRSYGCLDCHLF